MKTSLLISALILILITSGCELSFNKPKEVAFADVTDAYFLGTTPGESGATSSNNLVKIVSNDLESDPLSVDFLNEDGEVLGEDFADIYVNSIIPISPEYSILWGEFKFELNGGKTHSNGLLLKHETGALYNLAYVYYPHSNNTYMGSKYHQQDIWGNIYFFGEGVKRFHFDTPSPVGVEHYIDYPVDDEYSFFVDPYGNTFFNLGTKVKLLIGGIEETGSWMICINGFNGQVFGFETDTSSVLNLYSLTTEGGTISKEVVLESNILFESYYHGLVYYPDSANQRHFLMSNFLFRKSGEIYEHLSMGIVFDEEELKIYDFKLPEEIDENMSILGIEKNFLWLQDNQNESKLVSINLEEHTVNEQEGKVELSEVSEFEIPSNLEVQSINYSSANVIEFRSYDLSREVWVKGFISMANGLEYYDEESTLGSVTLTRIK